MTHDKWWYEVGSGIRPLPNEDFEEFSERVTRIAWDASVAAEREACAKVCDGKVDAEYATGKVDHNEMSWSQACAIAIRAREENP